MIFRNLTFSEGQVEANAEGHPTEVLEAFHSICVNLLSGKGAWRITEVSGECKDEEPLDSKMEWVLIAKLKEPS